MVHPRVNPSAEGEEQLVEQLGLEEQPLLVLRVVRLEEPGLREPVVKPHRPLTRVLEERIVDEGADQCP